MRRLLVTAIVAITLLSVAGARGDDGFYVIATGGKPLGTAITSLPYFINDSGFYYMTKNLSPPSNENGIYVNANNVTIDLLGFKITGPGSGVNYGIIMNGNNNVEIRNGTITGFSNGIFEGQSNAQEHRIINIRAMGNRGYGIIVTGSSHIVRGCTSCNNATGIAVGNRCLVMNNVINNNSYYGISAINDVLIGNNVAVGNGTKNIAYTTGNAFNNHAP
jgi:hypothetical protein